jgi:hypothetical protein
MEGEDLLNSFTNLELKLQILEDNCYFVDGFLGGKENKRSTNLNSFKRNLDRHYKEKPPSTILSDKNAQLERELIYCYPYGISIKRIHIKSRGYFELHNFTDLEEIASVIRQLITSWKEVKKSYSYLCSCYQV